MLIKNGYIIDPASGRAEFADLQISDGKIFSIGQHLSVSPSEEIIDASGLTIAPGLIDTHVHFRDPGFTYKEDIHTGAAAAAAALAIALALASAMYVLAVMPAANPSTRYLPAL